MSGLRQTSRRGSCFLPVGQKWCDGDFAASRDTLVGRALDGARPDLVKPFVPEEHWAFMAKMRHSAFFATPLSYHLTQLGTKRVS